MSKSPTAELEVLTDPVQVYVVDDEPVVQMTLSQLLKSNGYPVDSFGSAEDFIDGASLDEPYLLIVDKNLPGMSGLDLVVQQRGAGLEFEAILITGYADLDSAIQAVRLSFYSYMRKPFDFKKLLSDISGAEDRLRMRTEELSRNKDSISDKILDPVVIAEAHLGSVVESLQDVRLARPTRENLESAYERLKAVKGIMEQQKVSEQISEDIEESDIQLVDMLDVLNSVTGELGELSTQARIPLWLESSAEVEVQTEAKLLRHLLKSLMLIALETGIPGHPIVMELTQNDLFSTFHMVIMNNKEDTEEHEDTDFCFKVAQTLNADLAVKPYLNDDGFEYTLKIPLRFKS